MNGSYNIDINIKNRRSCRKFNDQAIERNIVETILTAGTLAPSGKNGQPWKFAVIHGNKELLKKISALTIYNDFVKNADCLVVVFLDKEKSYNYLKDAQAIGACIQNMLLQATALEVDSCWIGEILNKAYEVNLLLNATVNFELMAVIAFGYGEDKNGQTIKNSLESALLLFE